MNSKKLLVVDDEDNLRELAQMCLEDLGGWQTLAAASGEECLQVLQTESVSAILLDISMPSMDGIAVYEKLQANPKTQTIPVILLTARVLPSDHAKFAQMGVTGIISKPIAPTTLVAEVSEILGWEE